MDSWNPRQYNRFQSERSAPFWDLARLIDFRSVASMLDVGCGTGELTRELVTKTRVPLAVGMDSSPKMLADAEGFAGDGLSFSLARIEEFQPSRGFDVVISNAAVQWVDGHAAVMPRIYSWVAPGGQLAVQMPYNFDHPSHVLAEEMGAEFGLRVRKSPVLVPEIYAGMLDALGAAEVNVFMKVYLHHMRTPLEVVEWTKGTLLTHYEKQLPAERFADFLAKYTSALTARLGAAKDKPYLYTFKRLFLYARKPAG